MKLKNIGLADWNIKKNHILFDSIYVKGSKTIKLYK